MNYLRNKWQDKQKKALLSATKENTSAFSLKGKKCMARCIDVFDGDSITVIFLLNSKYHQFKIKMMGYNTPEIRTKNKDEKEYGEKAKKTLEEKILGKIITLECGDFDGFGRLSGTVCVEGFNVNEFMIREGYGKKYMGEKTKPFEEWFDTNK